MVRREATQALLDVLVWCVRRLATRAHRRAFASATARRSLFAACSRSQLQEGGHRVHAQLDHKQTRRVRLRRDVLYACGCSCSKQTVALCVPRARRLPSLVAGAGDLVTQINVAEVRRCAALRCAALRCTYVPCYATHVFAPATPSADVARVSLLVRAQILYRINRPNFTSVTASQDFPAIGEARRHRICVLRRCSCLRALRALLTVLLWSID
jgi:hypothetical protein